MYAGKCRVPKQRLLAHEGNKRLYPVIHAAQVRVGCNQIIDYDAVAFAVDAMPTHAEYVAAQCAVDPDKAVAATAMRACMDKVV